MADRQRPGHGATDQSNTYRKSRVRRNQPEYNYSVDDPPPSLPLSRYDNSEQESFWESGPPITDFRSRYPPRPNLSVYPSEFGLATPKMEKQASTSQATRPHSQVAQSSVTRALGDLSIISDSPTIPQSRPSYHETSRRNKIYYGQPDGAENDSLLVPTNDFYNTKSGFLGGHHYSKRPNFKRKMNSVEPFLHDRRVSLGEQEDYSKDVLVGNFQPKGKQKQEVAEMARARQKEKLEQVIGTLSDILSSPEKRKTLGLIKGMQAQNLIDYLVSIFSLPRLPPSTPSWLRQHTIKFLHKFCGNSMLYPQQYVLKDIEFGPQEGGGGFCDIYRGQGFGQQLCLKVVRLHQNSDSEKILKVYAREAILWGHLHHPNIVPFYGVHYTMRSRRVSLVSPWMKNGNITAYLKENPRTYRELFIHNVASGLQYLHDENIIHGDLKGVNVLVDDSGTACITDFGLSTFRSNNTFGLTTATDIGGRTDRWVSPELLEENAIPTRASDIWALGCVCYEIMTRLLPFKDCSRDIQILRSLDRGDLPGESGDKGPLGVLDSLDQFLWELIAKCWSRKPSDRPSCDEILHQIENYSPTLRNLTVTQTPDFLGTASQSQRFQVLRRASGVKINLDSLQCLLESVDNSSG